MGIMSNGAATRQYHFNLLIRKNKKKIPKLAIFSKKRFIIYINILIDSTIANPVKPLCAKSVKILHGTQFCD